jgi:haloacetate dehalogenase
VFEGFHAEVVDTGDAEIFTLRGGSGPPLLLLHGFPQSHVMWHKVAPALAEHFTVVLTDLRGYGQSSAPPSTADHEPYSKRVMAADQLAVLNRLGFTGEFSIAGHDRGGRCAYRLALDHPERVRRLAVLDIVPTGEFFARLDTEVALGYWHWFFLAQPNELPERMIGADPDVFFDALRSGVLNVGPETFTDEVLEIYRQGLLAPARVHAMCEDYRAGATRDLEADEADRGNRLIEAPTLALWGRNGAMQRWYDMPAIWRDWVAEGHELTTAAVDAGHFVAEQAPEETTRHLLDFFTG